MAYPLQSIRARFIDKFVVNSDTGCWEWTAGKNPLGYAGTTLHGHELTEENKVQRSDSPGFRCRLCKAAS